MNVRPDPPMVPLSELCEIRSGGTPSRSNRSFYNGDIPWAKISDLEVADGPLMVTEETITEVGLNAIRGRLFPQGTLLFAIYGSIGKMAFAGRALSANQAILGIEIRKSNTLDPRYLYHALLAKRAKLASDGQGIAQKNLSAAYVRSLEIPLPPLEEQRRIAAILDKADALRAKRKRALALLDTLTQSIFLDMFGDADNNHRGLPVVELGQLIADGPTNGLYKPASAYGEGAPILRINNFYDGEVVDIAALRRLNVTPSEARRYELRQDDIVINRVNSREYVGKSALVPELVEPTVYESNMMRLRVTTETILPQVCIQALQTRAVWRQIQAKTKDAINQSSINQKDVRSILLPLPLMADQRQFAVARQSAMALRRRIIGAATGAETLFTSLQSRAFTGQL